MSNDDDFPIPIPEPEDQDIDIDAYVDALDLKDIGTWKQEDQRAYIKARLKARQTQKKSGQKKKDSYSHWDLF